MVDQLRGEFRKLIEKQREAKAEKWAAYEEYKKWLSQKNEAEAEYYYGNYRIWSNEAHRLGDEIKAKLKAVQKYQSYIKWRRLRESLIRKCSASSTGQMMKNNDYLIN